jgi:hypothetical protein
MVPVSYVQLSRGASILISHHRDEICPHLLNLEGVPHAHTLVYPDHACLFETAAQVIGCCVSRRFHDLYPFLHEHIQVMVVINRTHHGEEIEVDGERLIGEIPDPINGLCQGLRALVHGGGQHSETSCVGDRRHKFRRRNPHHRAAHERVFDA